MDSAIGPKNVLEQPVEYVWHATAGKHALDGYDCVVLPGGFAYGDYLRVGAIAAISPVMEAVAAHAEKGGLVLGICNDFQILLEAGLLPGAILRNQSLEFRAQWVHLRVENAQTPFTREYEPGRVLRLPIAHGDGNYFADPETLAALEEHGQVLFRYCYAAGNVTAESNPNGSVNNIAGIRNRAIEISREWPGHCHRQHQKKREDACVLARHQERAMPSNSRKRSGSLVGSAHM